MEATRIPENARLLLLGSMLHKSGTITANGKALFKELIIRRDKRLDALMALFGARGSVSSAQKSEVDAEFLETVNSLIDDQARRLFEPLFRKFSTEMGKHLSKLERKELGLDAQKSLVYGEVDFESFVEILRKVGPSTGKKFYDLGSGTGRAVMAARITQDYSTCVGIESLSSLYNASLEVNSSFEQLIRQFLGTGQEQATEFLKGSITEIDWSDGDVVFANSTCFEDDLMEELSAKAELLKEGSVVITFTTGLDSPCFEVLEEAHYTMSWGAATVFIHLRNACPASRLSVKTEEPATPTRRPMRIHQLQAEDAASIAPLTSPHDAELMRRKRRPFPSEQAPAAEDSSTFAF